jgi:hypothetical protein
MNPPDDPQLDPQLLNPTSQLPANDGFFHNANGLSFKQATFNLVHGNMTVDHSGERRSHVRSVESITAKKTDCIQVEYVSMGRLRSANTTTAAYQFQRHCNHGNGVDEFDRVAR